nr:hypothetical protein [Dietzia maris]
MSAWVAGKDQIDLIVDAALAVSVRDPDTGVVLEDGTALGRELLRENVASVLYLYEGRVSVGDKRAYRALVEEYVFEECPEPRGPWREGEVAAAAVSSLAYQSCEHPGWSGSRAQRVLDLLRAWLPMPPGPFTEASRRGWSFAREVTA